MEHALGLGVGKWFLLQALRAAWNLNPQKLTVTTNNLDHPRAPCSSTRCSDSHRSRRRMRWCGR